MNECAKSRRLMAEALYDDLSPKDRAAFEAHLARCGACASEFAAMTDTRRILDTRERRDPGPAFWEGYWDRLAKRLDAEPAPRPVRRRAFRSFALFPAWAFRAAAAAALLLVGILIGRILLRPPAPRFVRTTPPAVVPAPGAGVLQASTPVLRARDYFERSKLILLGLVNYDPGASDTYGLDLPRQKRLSRELVNEAGSLKSDLKAPAEKRLRELVADLETILVQIANLESANDLDAVELVKNGVEEKGIFLKINLTEMGPSPKARTDKSPM
jgi:Putative zinc-finger